MRLAVMAMIVSQCDTVLFFIFGRVDLWGEFDIIGLLGGFIVGMRVFLRGIVLASPCYTPPGEFAMAGQECVFL